MSAPVPPIRELRFRLDKKSGRFVPCKDDDRRGTLTYNVDATGRSVMGIYPSEIGNYRLLGWRYPPGVDNAGPYSADPAVVVEWLQSHPKLEATK